MYNRSDAQSQQVGLDLGGRSGWLKNQGLSSGAVIQLRVGCLDHLDCLLALGLPCLQVIDLLVVGVASHHHLFLLLLVLGSLLHSPE